METHSSILAWKIPWTEEPLGLQSMGLQRVGHDWAHILSCKYLFPVYSCFLFLLTVSFEKQNILILKWFYFSVFLLCFFPLVWTCDLVSLSATWRHWINQLVWSIITVILIFVWEFPGEPMVRTLRFTAKGLDKIPACGARILQAVQHGAPSPPPPPPRRRFLENVPMMI